MAGDKYRRETCQVVQNKRVAWSFLFRVIPIGKVGGSNWHEIAVSAQRLKTEYFFHNVGCDRHPSFTTFREKILLGTINDANAAVVYPMSPGIHDFNIAEPKTRKK